METGPVKAPFFWAYPLGARAYPFTVIYLRYQTARSGIVDYEYLEGDRGMSQENIHRIEVVQRKEIKVDGVQHVESFTEEEITVDTNMGVVVLVGEGLNITQLDLQAGRLQVDGFIHAIRYEEEGFRKSRRGRNLLGRILK